MDSDSLHRLAKLLIDSGETSSIPEALDTFGRYGVKIRFDRSIVDDVEKQILALTALNCAARCFRGNVLVEGDDFELSAPGFEGQRMHSFLDWAGIKSKMPDLAASWPRIVINAERRNRNDIVAWSSGWEFGIGASPPTACAPFAPASVAAAGLAVSEAFSLLRADNPYAGCRGVRMSLWNPKPQSRYAVPEDAAPPQDDLWLLGLGHLGQAYAWTLGFLRPGPRPLFLQDIDSVTDSTLSTSLVSHFTDRGSKKTRVVAKWLEARGYQTALIERRFDEAFRVRPEEPATALFGVDNAAARRVLESAGFSLVIDAGLGSGFSDFRGLRVRTFPGPSRASELWASEPAHNTNFAAPYRQLIAEGSDACGVIMLATRAVGAPFVGSVAAAYVIAERVRRQLGGTRLGFIDFNLREPELAEVG